MDVEEKGEISLLDLLLVIAENLKLLVLGPLLVGFLVFGVAYVQPQKYVSQAILFVPVPPSAQASAQAVAMMTSPLVLDPVIDQFNLAVDRSTDKARRELANQIKAVVGKDNLLRLDMMASTPAEAQALANAVIDAWLKTTVPNEEGSAALRARLAWAKVSLESVRRFQRSWSADAGALNKPLVRGEAGFSLAALGQLEGQYLNDVLSIPRALKGLARDDVIRQMPTLPIEPVAQKKGVTAALSALAAGIVLFLWVFMRQAWRNAAQDPQAAIKLARLRAALGLGK